MLCDIATHGHVAAFLLHGGGVAHRAVADVVHERQGQPEDKAVWHRREKSEPLMRAWPRATSPPEARTVTGVCILADKRLHLCWQHLLAARQVRAAQRPYRALGDL